MTNYNICKFNCKYINLQLKNKLKTKFLTKAMSSLLLTIIVAVAVVAFFVLAMSLTLIFKGHHIDSEISTNKDMQRLGIKCAVQESREDTGTDCEDLGCKGNCSACDVDHSVAK